MAKLSVSIQEKIYTNIVISTWKPLLNFVLELGEKNNKALILGFTDCLDLRL